MTEIDLRLEYKSSTGKHHLSTVEQLEDLLENWSEDVEFNNYHQKPITGYAQWLEEKYIELINSKK